MTALIVEDLGKRYRLGIHRAGYNTLRDKLSNLFKKSPQVDVQPTDHWALRDVSFDVKEGEVVGLIGRNGAGKSTLLKILSRITCPTHGRVSMKGRLASLLEVGTGFHPELTGRENIYLNGAILGMTRAEVKANFDQIVEFSQIGKFLDTQVKFYSSGMYVRLAFAVAAHLTPEILIVDEVLAVGDQEFQSRCLGKMREVASSGRTVLFVSHSLPAVEALCSRAIMLSGGQVLADGNPRDVISRYLQSSTADSAWNVDDFSERTGTGRARFTQIELLSFADDVRIANVKFGHPFRVRMHFNAIEVIDNPIFGIAIANDQGQRVFLSDNVEAGKTIANINGNGYVDCWVTEQTLLPGVYQLEVWIADIRWSRFVDFVQPVGRIEVSPNADSLYLSDLSASNRGFVYYPTKWHVSTAHTTSVSVI